MAADLALASHSPLEVVSALPEMEFRSLAPFNQGMVGVFRCGAGLSPWELHPDDDELLQVLEGEVDIIVLTDAGPVTTPVGAGSLFVVPRGHWHRHHVRSAVKELFLTPGRSVHSSADDPRVAAQE